MSSTKEGRDAESEGSFNPKDFSKVHKKTDLPVQLSKYSHLAKYLSIEQGKERNAEAAINNLSTVIYSGLSSPQKSCGAE